MKNLKELVQEIKKLPLEEIRNDSEEGFEFVIKRAAFKKLDPLLQSFFGKVFKDAGQKPDQEATNLTASYGGIYDNQTLYLKKDSQSIFLAMIWPWNDGVLATVKIIPQKIAS